MATEILGSSRPITPHDVTILKPSIDFIEAQGAAGNITYVRRSGEEITVSVLVGKFYPIAGCVQIKQTGTTATTLVGF